MPPSGDQIRPVVVGDAVWIGMDCIVQARVTIGERAVIAAKPIRELPRS